jgi:hypothetical protein
LTQQLQIATGGPAHDRWVSSAGRPLAHRYCIARKARDRDVGRATEYPVTFQPSRLDLAISDLWTTQLMTEILERSAASIMVLIIKGEWISPRTGEGCQQFNRENILLNFYNS